LQLGGLGDRPHVAVFPPHLHESVVGHGVQRISVIETGHFGIVTAADCWGGLRVADQAIVTKIVALTERRSVLTARRLLEGGAETEEQDTDP
jgi:hypothetical protein